MTRGTAPERPGEVLTRMMAALIALVALLAGCVVAPGPPRDTKPNPSQARQHVKRVFVLRLIGICAGVNDFVAQQTKQPGGVQPAQVADRLEGLIREALSGAPELDRDKRDVMVTALLKLAGALRDLQRAGPAEEKQAKAAVDTAQAEADAAAHGYGMPPHLSECKAQMRKWQDVASLPLAVQQVASVAIPGGIWVLGGLTTGSAASRATFFFDPVTVHWSSGPDLPTELHHAMAVSYRDEPYVIGGWVPSGSGKITSGRVLRLHENRWLKVSGLNHPRAAAGAAVVDDQIIVVGGIDRGLVRQTEIFDGTSWREAPAIPVPGDHIAAVSDGRAVYAVGGRDQGPDRNSGALQRFDPATGRWSDLARMPVALAGQGVAFQGGQIYAAGGEQTASAARTVQIYDIAAGSWSRGSDLRHARHGLALAALGTQLYAIAGATARGHTSPTNRIEVMDLAGNPAPTVTPTNQPAVNLSVCPGTAVTAHRACLTSARVRNGLLTIRYTMNFTPSKLLDERHLHAHLFTARPDGKGGTIPPAADIQTIAGEHRGSWVGLYRRDVPVIDSSMHVGGRGRPLDTSAQLLCIRVASGLHVLARDRHGGLRTGNCLPIQR